MSNFKGWMAVTANLDDNISRIQRRLEKAIGQADKLQTIQENGRTLLNGFNEVLETLQKVYYSIM